jgi:hypothetical protein
MGLRAVAQSSSGGGGTWGSITGTLSDQTDLQTALDAKQATLVNQTNIKSINGTTLLGSGDLTVGGSPGGSDTQVQFNDSSAFGGDAGLTFNKTSDTLSVGHFVAVPLGATSGIRFGGTAATDILLETTNGISGESGYVLQVAKGNLSGEMPLSASKAVFAGGVFISGFDGPRLKGATTLTGFAITNSGASAYNDLEVRSLQLDARLNLKSYTVATLPAVGAAAGVVYVSDAAVAPCVAFSNGTNWKRCDDAATTVT